MRGCHRTMKILQVDQHYKYGGGTERYYLETMDMLERAGHEVVMVYGVRDERTLQFPHRTEHHIPGLEAMSAAASTANALKALETVVRKERPDVMHIHNVRNSRAIRLLTKMGPTVRFIHDPTLCCFRDWKLLPGLEELCPYRVGWRCYFTGCLRDFPVRPAKAILLKKLEMRTHRCIDRILVASKYMKNLLVFNGISENKISILPYFTNLPTIEDMESEPSEDIILFVGLMHPIKGVDKLIKALALVKNRFSAYLIGEGPYLEQYRQLAAAEGISDRVIFSGWIGHDKISEYYAKASVVVVPSWWIEAFGIVGIEAMAHAKPVVAFDTGGIRDWLTDGVTGFLVERGDIPGLAARIDELLSNRALAAQMGACARAIAEKEYNREDYISKLVSAYEDAVSSWKSPQE